MFEAAISCLTVQGSSCGWNEGHRQAVDRDQCEWDGEANGAK